MKTVYSIADNILSPLGCTTSENLAALRTGRSALRHYKNFSGRKEDDYVAARFSDEQRHSLMVEGLTWFESLVYRSAQECISRALIPVSSSKALFILSTTKGNIDHLKEENFLQLLPWESANRIAMRLGFVTRPMVVCNACISGVSAIIIAQRLIAVGAYDTIVVTGCDVITHFVVSGFQSLKAMSPAPCRPFDMERLGLNLGEAAATMVLTSTDPSKGGELAGALRKGEWWQIVSGAIRNDAYHISSPSPRGEGCADAIRCVTEGIDINSISAINVHGTATMFNDQMESKAIETSGLSDTPMNTLKGYYGHTLGASGILETIATIYSVEQGELLPTLNFSERGVSGRVMISDKAQTVDRHSFVKIISGFGGCNAALYCQRGKGTEQAERCHDYDVKHIVRLTSEGVTIDHRPLISDGDGDGLLTRLYRQHVGDYPRYYKMDRLSQLGFLASELLLREEGHREPCADRAVVLFNHTSSTPSNRQYEETIADSDNYFPGPSLFLHTLPNMVCGEIALRNGYHGETSFYIVGSKDDSIVERVVHATFVDKHIDSMLTGWVDYLDNACFEAELRLIERKTME